MDSVVLKVILALLPFCVLLVGFLAFKMDALKLSLYVWILELIIVIAFYKMNIFDSFKASIWGNITIWNGFWCYGQDKFSGNVFVQQVH